jgi:hypothetical protein
LNARDDLFELGPLRHLARIQRAAMTPPAANEFPLVRRSNQDQTRRRDGDYQKG